MKLIDLHEAVAKDFPWDENDIARESRRTSELFIKYSRLYSDEKMKVGLLENRLQGLIQRKRDYYAGNGTAEEYAKKPFNLKIRSDAGIQKYINGDDDVIAANESIIIQKQKVEILTLCLDEIKRRGFAMKTALDEIKYKNGEY